MPSRPPTAASTKTSVFTIVSSVGNRDSERSSSGQSPHNTVATENTTYSTANTSHSSIDTSSFSLADVEANRARFVRLTQDFQKIHESARSIEEEGLKPGGESILPIRSPIELSDEGSDDSDLGSFDSHSQTDEIESPRPLADVPQDISSKRRSRTLASAASTPILSAPPKGKKDPGKANSHETLNGTSPSRPTTSSTDRTHLTNGSTKISSRVSITTAERRPLTLTTAATIPVHQTSGGSRRVLGVGTGTGSTTSASPSPSPADDVSEEQLRPASAATAPDLRRPSPLTTLMRKGVNHSSASLNSGSGSRLGVFPEPPLSPPPASPLPSVPSPSFAAQQREHMRKSVGGSDDAHLLQPTQSGGHRNPKERSKTLPNYPSSPGLPPVPDAPSEQQVNAEAVALLKEHASHAHAHTQSSSTFTPNMKTSQLPAIPVTTSPDAASTRTRTIRNSRHNSQQAVTNRSASAAPSMIHSDVRASDEEYDLADYRSLRSTKRKRRLSDLSTWASVAPMPAASTTAIPIPPTPTGNANMLFPGGAGAYSVRSTGTTIKARDAASMAAAAVPGGANIWEDLEFALKQIVNPRVFRDFVRDALGRHRFREFLVQEGNGDAADLDLWIDLSYSTRSMGEIRSGAQAVYDLYLSPSAPHHVNMPSELQQELLRTLRPYLQLGGLGFETTQQHLLERMYAGSFQRFMRYKLIQECAVQLGKHNLPEAEQEGLGDCFCLTNPRLPDHPVVLVTDGFVAVTGYPRQEIVGRNCRFLQGPGTSPQAVQRIRDGLNSGEGCTELLLNYRRNGEPFYCLLCIIPLRDASGAIAYFIGGQTNVTGIMSGNKNLGFLLGAGELKEGERPSKSKMSPTMMRYKMEKEDSRSVDAQTLNSRKTRNLAAGSQLPLSESSLQVGSVTPRAISSFADLHEKGGGTSSPSPFSRGASLMATASRFLRGRTSAGIPTDGSPKPVDSRKQLIAGAEATLNGTTRGLEDQMTLFKDLYQQVVIFKKERREITFVTKQLLAFLGLPRMTKRDLYCSALIHADLLAILTGHDKTQTRQIRKEVKRAILRDEALSIPCGFKFLGKGKIKGTAKHKFGVLHMTPLKDLDNNVVAFVGIFA